MLLFVWLKYIFYILGFKLILEIELCFVFSVISIKLGKILFLMKKIINKIIEKYGVVKFYYLVVVFGI